MSEERPPETVLPPAGRSVRRLAPPFRGPGRPMHVGEHRRAEVGEQAAAAPYGGPAPAPPTEHSLPDAPGPDEQPDANAITSAARAGADDELPLIDAFLAADDERSVGVAPPASDEEAFDQAVAEAQSAVVIDAPAEHPDTSSPARAATEPDVPSIGHDDSAVTAPQDPLEGGSGSGEMESTSPIGPEVDNEGAATPGYSPSAAGWPDDVWAAERASGARPAPADGGFRAAGDLAAADGEDRNVADPGVAATARTASENDDRETLNAGSANEPLTVRATDGLTRPYTLDADAHGGDAPARQAYGGQANAMLAPDAAREWTEIAGARPLNRPVAQPLAEALELVARRIREGEISAPGYEEGMGDAAALAAVLAAVLGVRQ